MVFYGVSVNIMVKFGVFPICYSLILYIHIPEKFIVRRYNCYEIDLSKQENTSTMPPKTASRVSTINLRVL